MFDRTQSRYRYRLINKKNAFYGAFLWPILASGVSLLVDQLIAFLKKKLYLGCEADAA